MTLIYNPDGGIESVIEDTTPQLGGNLDLNSNNITGTGNIDITGDITATTFIGDLRGASIFQAKAGEALTKGDPVYISGDDIAGNKPIVSIADSDDANKMPCFGLAAETVSLNANVNVVTFGTLSGMDTSSFSQGDILYISTTGTLTATKPSGESSLIQNIGKVIRSHPSVGSIKVGGAGRTNDVPNLNDGNVFIGNASNQAETRALTLDDISETATNKHFTASDNTKLDGIAAGAEVNVNADWNASSGDAQILNKPTDITDLSIHNVTELADVSSAGSGSIITSAERTKLAGIEAGATTDQTKADIDALGIDADTVDSLQASQFLRSDTGDTINVGRGNVYIENNSNDNQNGAGITIRTSNNPAEGDIAQEGSIFAVRSSGHGPRLWVGQSLTTTGSNDFKTQNATINKNISILGDVNYSSQLAFNNGSNNVFIVTTAGIELLASSQYYFMNNHNVLCHINPSSLTPNSTLTEYYAEFPTENIINSDIFEYSQPTASSNSGFKLKKAGYYKVTYCVQWENESYNNRVNYKIDLVKHSSAITPTRTDIDGSRSYSYSRASTVVKFATNNNTVIINVSANEYIKLLCVVSKNTSSFGSNFSGLKQKGNGAVTIEYLGPMA